MSLLLCNQGGIEKQENYVHVDESVFQSPTYKTDTWTNAHFIEFYLSYDVASESEITPCNNSNSMFLSFFQQF